MNLICNYGLPSHPPYLFICLSVYLPVCLSVCLSSLIYFLPPTLPLLRFGFRDLSQSPVPTLSPTPLFVCTLARLFVYPSKIIRRYRMHSSLNYLLFTESSHGLLSRDSSAIGCRLLYLGVRLRSERGWSPWCLCSAPPRC